MPASITDRSVTVSGPRAPAADCASLRLDGVTKVLGGRTVVADLDLSIASGELVCLLGASGCGKTTTLRMIGGFVTPDRGRITIDGTDVTNAPPERRPTAMVFQNYALWPHMSVFDNIAFGLKVRRMKRAEITERVDAVLETVGLMHHRTSHPGAISGGEQQRVALARSLVLEPSVLLLDEPLSNLDAKLRVRVREEIRELQKRSGITMVFVTHDQEEALALGDRIAVMNAGRVEQFAAPDDVYRAPSTPFVARFVGTMNFVDAEVRAAGGGHVAVVGDVLLPVVGVPEGTQGPVRLAVRPEDVRLDAPDGASGTVVRDTSLGHYRELTVQVGGIELRVFAPAASAPTSDVRVRFDRVMLFPAGQVT